MSSKASTRSSSWTIGARHLAPDDPAEETVRLVVVPSGVISSSPRDDRAGDALQVGADRDDCAAPREVAPRLVLLAEPELADEAARPAAGSATPARCSAPGSRARRCRRRARVRGSWSRTSGCRAGRTGSAMYGGFGDDEVGGERQARPAGRRTRSACARPTPWRAALRRATTSAAAETSVATTRAAGSSCARETARQPLPVPTSITNAAPAIARRRWRSAVTPPRRELGFGPRDEHVGRHLEVEAPELAHAE